MNRIILAIFGLIIAMHFNLSGQKVGDPAPDFEVDLLDGSKFKLSDHQGEVVFIFLFGNTCPSCIAIGPTIESSIYQVYMENPNFTAIGLDTWNNSSNTTSVTGFMNATGLSFPLAIKAGSVATDFSTTYDRLMVVDHQGVLVHKGIILAGNDVNNALESIKQSLAAIPTDPCETAEINIAHVVTPPSCYGESDGSIDVSVTGTNPSFTFSWSNGSDSEDIMDLTKGVYNVNVTDSEGCVEDLDITVAEPQILSVSESVSQPSCATDSLGSIQIEISGGTEPYLTTLSEQEFQDMIGNLGAGEYILNVVDAHNCMTSDSITITEPNMISTGEITGSTEVDGIQTYTYSVSDNANIVFHWSVAGGTILSGQGIHTVNIEWGSNNEGQVEVLAESGSGCKSDTTKLDVTIQSTTSATDHTAALISIYPNPAGDILYVSTEKEVVVSLFDITGQLKLTTSEKRIDLSTLGKGTYFVTIRSEEVLKTERIIKY